MWLWTVVWGLALGLDDSMALNWDYSVLQQTGKHCPERDSCNFGRSSRGSLELDWRQRNCFCDSSCSLYGDCCIDARAFDPQQQREQFGHFQCRTLRQYGDVYMRSDCPEAWPLPHIAAACRGSGSQGDPMARMPVTHRELGVTYSNYYCAVCNGHGKDLAFWKPRLECPTLQGYNARFHNISREYLAEKLVFQPKKGSEGQWGVELETIEGIPPVFHECYLDPFLPEEIEDRVRLCSSGPVTSTCPTSSPEEEQERCASYTGLVYSEDRAYRNAHCALCNNVTVSSLICLKLEGRRMWGQDYFRPLSFAVLFDISGQGEQVGENSQGCTEEELWDPFFQKCRNVVCGQEGWVWALGDCWPPGGVPTTTTSTTSTTSTSTTTTESTTTPPTTTIGTTSTTTSTTSTTTTSTTTTQSPTTSSRRPGQILFPTESSHSVAINFPKVTTTATTTTTTTPASTTTTTKRSVPPPVATLSTSPSSVTSPMNTSSLASPPSPSLQTCPQFRLLPGEYTRLSNGSIHVSQYSVLLPPGHYRPGSPGSGSLYICSPSSVYRGQAKFSPIMGYVTFACLGVSLVCLLLHLLISLLAPELQNLSGKNLSSLSLALVGAYSSFLANMFTRDLSSMQCFLLAVAMYYFYLSAFAWMLNIAFDVARTLKQATTQLRLTSGSQWGRFLLYSLLGWLGPGSLVTAAVLLDRLPLQGVPSNYRPGFGSSGLGICWFGSRTALVIYFVIPFSVVLGLNLGLFIYSSCLVWDTTRTSAKITTSGPKTNYRLYLRLATLMGLSWAAGIIAGSMDVEPVWYVFLVLNTLQGLFILVFFTCSKKVVSSVKERLCGGGEEEAGAWRWQHHHQHSQISSSQDSGVSGSTVLSSSRAFHARTPSTSSYDHYHQYDQRFYS